MSSQGEVLFIVGWLAFGLLGSLLASARINGMCPGVAVPWYRTPEVYLTTPLGPLNLIAVLFCLWLWRNE